MAKEEKQVQHDEEFKPQGTILILILFMLTMIFLWGSIYFILLQRGVTI
jgi:hypothetical protein